MHATRALGRLNAAGTSDADGTGCPGCTQRVQGVMQTQRQVVDKLGELEAQRASDMEAQLKELEAKEAALLHETGLGS